VTPAELRAVDCIGLPRFTAQQAKAVIDLVRSKGLLKCDPPSCEGRGVLIVAGGRYTAWGWVLCRRLREMGCNLPIQVWYLGTREMPEAAKPLFKKLDAELVDAHQVMMKHPAAEMHPWALKTYALRHTPWRHVCYIDADCVPQILPEELLNDKDVKREGSIFFHDVGKHNNWNLYADFSLLPTTEWETGQWIWDKVTGWMALRWAMWAAEHTQVFWNSQTGGHGEKATVECAFRFSQCPHMMGGPSIWAGYGIEHSFKGRIAFKHIMGTKRGEFPMESWMLAMFEEWKSMRIS
jgi:Mannosyltransferase putative